MFYKLKISNLILGFLMVHNYSTLSQNNEPFQLRQQISINGNITVISNQILNRKSGREGANTPYNDQSDKIKLNDEFDMFYVDVDNDSNTFSSSSADLELKNPENKKIVFAGLYWSATYRYNSGKRDRYWEFKPIDVNRESFDEVLLKLPGNSEYNNIKGKILFDGFNHPMHRNMAPYVCFADITSLINSNENFIGTYTLANIRATQGKLPGGSAGGWLIYFVYEDPNESNKFIVSYDGFAGISSRPKEIEFSGFKTLPEGTVKATLALAALEGDFSLDGDQIELKSDNKDFYNLISHPLKPENNFFNSSLVLNDDYFINRNPNSLNTLGFDTSLFELNNENNTLIDNQTKNVNLKLKTNGDNYFFFWTAFAVESTPEEIIEDKYAADILESNLTQDIIKDSTEVVQKLNTVESTKIKREQLLEERMEYVANRNQKLLFRNEMTKESEVIKSNYSNERIVALPGENFIIPQRKKGYYIVANVFAKHRNAERFTEYLKNLGIAAEYFINPHNNYRYVYVKHTEKWEDALKVYYSDVEGKYKGDMWIMIVNTTLQNDSTLSFSIIPNDLK